MARAEAAAPEIGEAAATVADGQAGEAAAASAEEPRYTLDELARLSGLPARTIRHYQSEKLLPAPEREGRTARYREAHLERLGLIGRLQDRGLSLKAIRDVLRRVDKGKLDLEDWLGIGEQLERPWTEDRPQLLDEDELAERLAGHRPGLTAELVEHGLLQANDTLPPTYLVTSPGLLDVALRLESAGVDVTTFAGALERMRKHVRKAAQDVVEHVIDRAGQGFGQEPEQVTEALAALPEPTLDAVRLVFTREMERALRSSTEQLGTVLGKRRSERDDA
ncbi:MAG: MerR family transcriptional regulator [Actinomycetota bacterium]